MTFQVRCSIYTNMNTKSVTPNVSDRALSTQEARLVADWMERKNGEKIRRGANALWKLRPSAISRMYHVTIWDILVAARRVEGEEAK